MDRNTNSPGSMMTVLSQLILTVLNVIGMVLPCMSENHLLTLYSVVVTEVSSRGLAFGSQTATMNDDANVTGRTTTRAAGSSNGPTGCPAPTPSGSSDPTRDDTVHAEGIVSNCRVCLKN